MFLDEWLSLAIICSLGAISPGPSLIVILSLTTSHGRKAGYIASVGHGLGVFIYALLSATGLALVLNTHSRVFLLVQILGALFLFYLGARIILSSLFKNENRNPLDIFNQTVPNSFVDGFLIAILNPKIAVFFLSLFSQFLYIGQSFSTHFGMAVLAGIIDTLAYLMMVTLISISVKPKSWSLSKKSVEIIFGFLLIILSVSLCFKLIIDYN